MMLYNMGKKLKHLFLHRAWTYYKEKKMELNEIMKEIISICKQYEAEAVYLYGSQAKGTSTERSDIDIAVSGVKDIYSLRDKIDDIMTLRKIDLLDLDDCENNLLLEDIHKYGREIYKKI